MDGFSAVGAWNFLKKFMFPVLGDAMATERVIAIGHDF